MKKFFIYASAVGLAAGVIYLLCKKEKSNDTADESVDNKAKFEPKPQEKDISKGGNVVEEIYNTKSESVNAVDERHSEAGEIMKDAYRNIMENFVEDFSDEEVAKENEDIVDSESVSVIKESDSISDELDDLLK